MPDEKLPNFFILGAPKCGTTAVAKVISTHPDIFVPPEKEVRYFSDDSLYQQGTAYLAERFSAAAAANIRCDASPQYIYNKKVMDRMIDLYGEELADLRFMVMLRDPVDRAYSAYWMAVRYGWEERSFDEAVEQNLKVGTEQKYQADGQFNIHSYIEAGMYFKQIEPWLKKVPEARLKIYTQEVLQQQPDVFYQQLSKYLGVELIGHVDTNMKVNQASMPRSKTIMKMTDEKSILKEIIKPFIPQNLRYRLRRSISDKNLKPTRYEPMSKKTRDLLVSVYRDDVDRLRSAIDIDLELWKSEYAK